MWFLQTPTQALPDCPLSYITRDMAWHSDSWHLGIPIRAVQLSNYHGLPCGAVQPTLCRVPSRTLPPLNFNGTLPWWHLNAVIFKFHQIIRGHLKACTLVILNQSTRQKWDSNSSPNCAIYSYSTSHMLSHWNRPANSTDDEQIIFIG